MWTNLYSKRLEYFVILKAGGKQQEKKPFKCT